MERRYGACNFMSARRCRSRARLPNRRCACSHAAQCREPFAGNERPLPAALPRLLGSPQQRNPGEHAMSAPPFDAAHLDRLMDEAGIDVLLATSKHNVQYLLGGHRALFFDYMDAIGVSRYLPAFVYPKGKPDKAAYIGHRIEGHQVQVAPLWPNTGS